MATKTTITKLANGNLSAASEEFNGEYNPNDYNHTPLEFDPAAMETDEKVEMILDANGNYWRPIPPKKD
jgi:hypothetical protein